MIALIGGLDPLTHSIASTLRASGREHVICVLSHESVLDPAPGSPVSFRLEHFGTLLRLLAEWGVTKVCLSGAIKRPELDTAQVDAPTARLLPRIAQALVHGDDSALRSIIGILEEAGFQVIGAHDVNPALLATAGVLTVAHPTPRQEADALRAEQVHRILAAADLGQGLIMRDGLVLAVEALPGTDFMIESVKGLAKGGLLYKAPKTGQDRRADLPVIGVKTVEKAANSGLSVIVVQGGGVMILDRDATVRAADEAGLVFWVRGTDT